MIGLFFKFNRFWSVRNLDLLMLIALAPGLLLIHFGQVTRSAAETSSAEPTATETEQGTVADSSESSEESDAAKAPPPDESNPAPTEEESTEDEPQKPTAGKLEYYGYMSLLAVGLFWMVRMLLDTRLTRRP